MDSLVYFFSHFTREALLFEALLICILCGGYAAYWIFIKYRAGVIRDEIPGQVVKDYLNELIADAERLREQLFGLLKSKGKAISNETIKNLSAALIQSSSDPEFKQKVLLLESKMAEQAQSIQNLLTEKERIEKELLQAKASGTSSGTSNIAPNASSPELQARIQVLEAKLAEYSIIEDDLANLKRLQQENAQLKAALADTQTAQPLAATAPVATAAIAASASAPTAAPTAGPPATTDAPTSPSSPATTPAQSENNDADLVAEFEKMLNS